MCSGVFPFLSSQSISAPSEGKKLHNTALVYTSIKMRRNKAAFLDDLTVLNDGLRARKPPMNGCHVQGSFSIFTLNQNTNNKVTFYVQLN